MKKGQTSKKTNTKTKETEDNEEYYTREEEERIDKFKAETGKKFDDDEIYALMLKYKDDDDAILNDLKEQLKERNRGEEFEWKEIGKGNYIFLFNFRFFNRWKKEEG